MHQFFVYNVCLENVLVIVMDILGFMKSGFYR